MVSVKTSAAVLLDYSFSVLPIDLPVACCTQNRQQQHHKYGEELEAHTCGACLLSPTELLLGSEEFIKTREGVSVPL